MPEALKDVQTISVSGTYLLSKKNTCSSERAEGRTSGRKCSHPKIKFELNGKQKCTLRRAFFLPFWPKKNFMNFFAPEAQVGARPVVSSKFFSRKKRALPE